MALEPSDISRFGSSSEELKTQNQEGVGDSSPNAG
jgi:hypothetical protein